MIIFLTNLAKKIYGEDLKKCNSKADSWCVSVIKVKLFNYLDNN